MKSKPLWIVFFVALILRLGYGLAVGEFGRTPPRHYREYVTAATRLLEQGAFTSPLITEVETHDASALMPPVYQLIVAAAYGVLGVESVAATALLHLLNALAGSLTVTMTFAMAGRLAGPSAAWIAFVIACLNPTLVVFTTYVWDTCLFTLGVTVAVWISVRFRESTPAPAAWLGFGVFLGALALLNPALTICYPLLVLWPATARGWQPLTHVSRGALLTMIGWAAAIGPWTLRNYLRFDRVMYVRSGFWLETWLGVCPEADTDRGGVYRQRFPLQNQEVQQHVRAAGETEYLRECRAQALDAIRRDPWRFLRLIGWRCVDYWAGTVLTHAGSRASPWPKQASRAITTIFLSGETLVTAILFALTRRQRKVAWLLGLIVLFSVVYCVTHVQLRYRTPSEPLFSVALAALASRRRGPRDMGAS